MDDFISLTQDKLAVISVVILLTGLVVRSLLFANTLRDGNIQRDESRFRYAVKNLGRLLIPLHRVLLVKPAYTVLRYLFHLCLFLVLFTGSSHLAVLKSIHVSILPGEPPEWFVDRVTVLLIGFLTYFLLQKFVLKEVPNQTKKSEGLFVAAVALPVISGYVAHHGWLNFELVLALHLASGVALLLSMLFLFCKSTVATEKCTGCKACSVLCPTGALRAVDNGGERIFEYSHYQCVCCGTCVSSCPEGAVSLRHRIGFRYAIEYLRVPDRTLPLHECEQCGQTFTSESQLDQIDRMVKEQGLELSSLYLCERCKRRSTLAWVRPLTMRRESSQNFQPANQ